MEIIAYIAQSLDGYIAGSKGELDWLQEVENPGGSDFGFAEFMSSINVLLMGRNTFEKVASFDYWPYDKHVFVASNSLSSLPVEYEGKASLASGSLSDMLAKIESEGFEKVYIDGGRLIQSALQNALLDEITVTTLPVILGQGISLFGHLDSKVKLSLVGSEVLVGQMVKTQYKVTRT